MGPLFIISILLLAGAFGVSRWARFQEARGRAVALTAEVPVKQLAEDAASVAQELGPGSYRQPVHIRGRIVCDTPLTAELSRTSCVSYRFSVTREYEEVLWEKDANGNNVQRTHRKSEVVASHEASVPFWLDDGTGRILVHPEHAKVELLPSHSSFQPAVAKGIGMGLGTFVVNLPVNPGSTLGYRYEEKCLPVDVEVTVVAEAGDLGGELALRRPDEKDSPFLVTPKTFAELARSNKTFVSVLKGVSWGLVAVSVLIFLLGVIR